MMIIFINKTLVIYRTFNRTERIIFVHLDLETGSERFRVTDILQSLINEQMMYMYFIEQLTENVY